MIVTVLVLYGVRSMLRTEARRRKTVSILLVGASLTLGDGRLNDVYGQERIQSRAEADARPDDFTGGDESILFRENQKLREGTLVPPTIGRVVNLGRRWAFVPTDSESTTAQQTATTTSRLTPRGIDDSVSDAEAAESHRYVILCENQMLQRIVEAMRGNQVDDRWEVSGEVLEFFERNRLLIRTAQRANLD